MNRLVAEISRVGGVLGPAGLLRYCVCLGMEAPGCVRTRRLAPADARMTGRFTLRVRGRRMVVPAGEMDEMLRAHGDTCTFSGVREMIANDVYLRAFRVAGDVETAVDLGSNRGLFLAVALRVLGARIVAAAEPQAVYDPVWKRLVEANRRPGQQVHRVCAAVGLTSGAGWVTMENLLDESGIGTVDFLKCDIEGGEYALFDGGPAWLARVRNLALEIHDGDKAGLRRALEQAGFATKAADQQGREGAAAEWEYLYASRTRFVIGEAPDGTG